MPRRLWFLCNLQSGEYVINASKPSDPRTFVDRHDRCAHVSFSRSTEDEIPAEPRSSDLNKGNVMRVSIVCSLVFAGLTLLPHDAAAQFTEKKVLTLEVARKIVAAAQAEATRMNLGGAIAVVDDGGWPILVERMDN